MASTNEHQLKEEADQAINEMNAWHERATDLLAERDRYAKLLEQAYHRLMISEGDARYMNGNLELALKIGAALGIDP